VNKAVYLRPSGSDLLTIAFPFCSHYACAPAGPELRHCFALRGARKQVRGFRTESTEEERYRLADDVVHQLKQYGDPWRLSEDLPPPGKGHST
jgi:hypothetical protein